MNKISSFGRDLVQDLRDRNLLIPVIALLVAIVAVPILLGSGGGSADTASTTPATPSAPDSMSGSAEISPVVLADVPGLRDYKKRLNGDKGRNPFIQQTVDQPSDKGSGGGSGTGTASGTSTDTSSTASSTDTSASTSTPPASSTPDSTTGGTSPDTGTTKPPKDKLVKYTIDVRVGRAGKTKVLKDVEPLQLLPGDKRPVVQYVNTNVDGSRAGFVVSPLVTSAEGDGKCDPGRNNCQFLFLEEGQIQKLVYGDKQETYRVELLRINKVLVPFDSSKSADSTTEG